MQLSEQQFNVLSLLLDKLVTLTKDSQNDFGVADKDESGASNKYYGFQAKSQGNDFSYYIMRENTISANVNNYTYYCNRNSIVPYATAWTNRASNVYEPYNKFNV